MAEQPTSKLAVILHADVVGSTALVQRDERRAHERITSAFQRFSQTIQEYGGQVHEIRGDALVAEFARASDAVCAAIAFQQGNTAHNKTLDDDINPEVRIGISLGEVVIADNTVTGAGVVLAQRVEQLAESGGLCITEAIHEATPGRLPLDIEHLGEQKLKGFEQPVHVHAVRLQPNADVPSPEPRQAPKRQRTRILATAMTVSLVVGIALAWLKPWQPDTEPATVDRMVHTLPSKPSIAVLPFTNLTGDSEQDYFVDGFTNEIITNLSKFPEFFVIASNSVFTYKDKAVGINEIGRELGVRYVLEGSLQRSSNNISVHAQLIEAASENHIWAESYEVMPEEVFAVQRDLTQQITSTLASRIADFENAALLKKEDTNLAAYELYLKGRKYRFGKEPFEESVRLLERAIALAPNFAAAYSALANRYLALWRNRFADDPDEAVRRAREAAQKAIALDQQDYRSHWALGQIHLWAEQDHDLALAEYEKALALNPNKAALMAMTSTLMSYMGRAEDAVHWIEKAKRLDPYHPVWYDWVAGFAYFMARDYEKAVLAEKKTIAVHPKNISARRSLIAAYVEMGRMEEAQKVAGEILEIDPEFKLSKVRSMVFQHRADHDRYFGALAKAGLPE